MPDDVRREIRHAAANDLARKLDRIEDALREDTSLSERDREEFERRHQRLALAFDAVGSLP